MSKYDRDELEAQLMFDQVSMIDGYKPNFYHDEDKLEIIYTLQKKLVERYLIENSDIHNFQMSEFFKCDFVNNEFDDEENIFPTIKENLLTDTCNFIAEEAFELKRHFNYKSWKNWKEPNSVKAKEELIDIFHFVMQAAILLGMSADDIVLAYREKNKTNHERQSGDY